MIIDLILDRKDGVPFDAKDFYRDVMSYESTGMSDGREISQAMDEGSNEDVQKALLNYVLWSVNGDRQVAGVEPLSLEEISNSSIGQFIKSKNWIESDTSLNEGYLNMTSIPTIKPALEDDWYLPEIADDEYNCGIDCNTAPMVGSQEGQALATMSRTGDMPLPQDANLDYLMKMAGLDGTEVEPIVPTVEPEVEVPVSDPNADIFSIAFDPEYNDMYNADYDMTDADYDDAVMNAGIADEPVDDNPTELEIPYENEMDMYDGIMNTPLEDTVEEVPEAVPEVPVEDTVVDEPIVDTVEEPVEDTETEEVIENNESDPEDMVLEKQPIADDTEAQQIKDYLVHNKEVLFGPASVKVEKYKKSLDGKSIEELRVEAEEVSPNWKKYIGKYKVNESTEIDVYSEDFDKLAGITSDEEVEDSVEEEVPADKQILTEEGEELSDEDMTEIEDTDAEAEITESAEDLTKSPVNVGSAIPSALKESEEKIEAKNVDVETEEVKVEETKESDLKHEIPENDMIKDNIDTGAEVKYDEPVEAENGDIETKEFEVKETTEADLKHEIKDNEPIEDNIDTGKEVKFDEPVEAENVNVEIDEKAGKLVAEAIYSVELTDKFVEAKSAEEFQKIMNENFGSVKSIVII